MNKAVLRALVTLTVAALVSVQSLVATPYAGTKSVLGGPSLSIGLAKDNVGAPNQQVNGSFNHTYVFRVKNWSNVTVYNVQVIDNLISTFTAAGSVTVTNLNATGSLAVNAGYNGTSDTQLLNAGASTLVAGAEETITLSLNTFVPSPGNYLNSATATATDITGNVNTSDVSNWGSNTDPQGSDPTLTPLTGNTQATIGIAKTIYGDTTINCLTTINYQIRVKNIGTEDVDNIQVTDLLDGVFPAPSTFTVSNVSLGGPNAGGITLGTYDGTAADSDFLVAASSSLGVGQEFWIFFDVTVDFAGNYGAFGNSATVTAQGSFSNQPTTDISNNGLTIDPNLDGNPNEPLENNPTLYNFEGINIGLAKGVTATLKPDGTYDVEYSVLVRNFYNSEATNLQIIDDLSLTFPSPVVFTMLGVPTTTQGTLVVNPGFGLNNDWNLLSTSTPSSLSGNLSAYIFFKLNVNLNNTTDTLFLNSAIITSTGACGIADADTSTDGNNPDLDADGEPDSQGEAVPTPIVLKPTTSVIPGGFSPNGDGTNDFFVISNIGGKKVSLEIFNRWGAAVYKNDNYDNTWDGSSNTGLAIGDNLPTGTYWYVIKIDDTKEVKEYANYLTLSR